MCRAAGGHLIEFPAYCVIGVRYYGDCRVFKKSCVVCDVRKKVMCVHLDKITA